MGDFDRIYHIFKDYNIPFDEKGSMYGTVRKIQWVKPGEEPDESKAKFEIRKILVKDDGENLMKGYTFATEEGPSELAEGLVKAGFGDTKEILRSVRIRKDFLEAANSINEDDDGSTDGEMFDMRDLLIGMDDSMEDEE